MQKRTRAFACAAVLCVALPAAAEQVYLSEIQYNPKGSAPEFIEITNATSTTLDMAEWAFSDGIDYTFPEFSDANAEASFLKAWERIVVTNVDEGTFRAFYPGVPAEVRVFGPWSGSLSNAGEAIELQDKNGIPLSRVDYRDGGRKWPVAADGTGHSLRLKNLLRSADDWRNWEVSLGVGGTPGTEPQQGAGRPMANPEIDLSDVAPLAAYDSVWNYHDLTAEPPANWNAVDFDDGGWGSHPGMFGFDSSRPLPEPGLWEAPAGEVNWRRDSLGGLITWYARYAFDFHGETEGATLSLEGFLDDGAIFYLNGQELDRLRMPAGAVDWQTEADRATENTEPELLMREGVSSQLVQGRNVLAVEVHNESTGSSDIVFGADVRLERSRGDVVINEVFPGGAGSGFVEFYNAGGSPVDLNGYFVSDDPADLRKTALGAVSVPASGFVTVGYTESGLGGDAVYLTHSDGVTVLDAISLTAVADGESIGRKPSGSSEWFAFGEGTPGSSNVGAGDLAGLLELSEVHFDGSGNVAWVELFATSPAAVDTTGLFLATRRDFSDRVALGGAVPGRGYASFDAAFPVGGNGEVTLYLVSGGGLVIDAAELDRNAGQEGFQVLPPGSGEWYGSAGDTRDAANDPDRQTDIVIHEIMCDPPSDSRNGEFVELYNRGNATVDLTGWEFVDGIGFEFPAGTSIPAGGYLVVAANPTWVKDVYGAGLAVAGPCTGNLSNGGELLRLEDANGELVDEVDYRTGGDWPALANGDGSSMELVHPDADNDLPSAWRDSDESAKSSFESFAFTGRYWDLSDERRGSPTDYKELHLHLVGDAHVVLRNIRLERGGTDLLQNADRDTRNGSGATGWLTQGTHHASHFEGNEFHLISDGHGDNRANRAEIDCTRMNRNDTLTLRFEGRWVFGKPTMIAQTFDHSFAHVAHFEVPDNLGTPGAPNSVALAQAPPVLGGLLHTPAVPKSTDNVVVTARVGASAGGAAGTVELRYAQDASSGNLSWRTAAMNDSGTGGDAVAGDGVWSGRITDMKADRRVVAFYVRARSAGGAEVTLPARGEAAPAMYIVDNREPSTDLKTFRWIVSGWDRGAWTSGQRSSPYNYKFPKLSNSYKNLTLIVNESEVVYNAEVRPSGSPWHTGHRANLNLRGKFRMPGDHLIHGISKLAFDNTPGAEGAGALYHNKLPRYWLYLMGHEQNESEFATIIDGTTARHAVEIFEPIGNDFLQRNFGDEGSSGELFRIDDIFRFSDADINGTSKDQITNRFWWYAGDQWDGPGRYHTQWLLRSNEADYDYSTLLNMLETVSRNRYDQEEIERLIDARRSALMMAVRGYMSDWDNITLNRPKNSFFYRAPGDGKFHFFHHDSDLAFRNGDLNDQLVATHGNNVEMRNWVRKPYNQRIFRYYLSEIVDKYSLNSARMDEWFRLEDAASVRFRPNSYRGWFSGRNRSSQMRLEMRTHQTTPLSVNAVANTGEETISITGSAGYRVWEVVVDGQPDAEFTWTGESTWRIDGISLKSGLNNLTVRGVDDDGKPAFSIDDVALNVTKTGDSPPVAVLESDPKSGRTSSANALELDARDSFDPEGEPVTFAWVTPPSGVASFSDTGDGRATATFDTPGLYDFTVNVSDGAGDPGSEQKEIAVYGPSGFSSFGDSELESYWNEENVGSRGNSNGSPWYSLEEDPGRLTLFVPDTESLPLRRAGAGGSTVTSDHPWLWRDLPDQGDWVLETELEVVGAQFGTYSAGLMVSVTNGASEKRYAFGFDEGEKLTVFEISPSSTGEIDLGDFSASDDVALRVTRSGGNLQFQWRYNDEHWSDAQNVPLGAFSTVQGGGVYLSTVSAETAKVSFDYVMLIDPSMASPFRGQIVLSEIMYKPDGGSSYEFLELQNVSGGAIDLGGFRFVDGAPFAELTLPGASIPGGAYGLVVADQTAFTSRHGAEAAGKILAQWGEGSLSNGGERITLLDNNGLVVFSIEYSDGGDWPDAPDEHGASLVYGDPAQDPVLPGSWSASFSAGGSPGSRDGESLAEWQARTGTADLNSDANGNGLSGLLEFALGVDLIDGPLSDALPQVGTEVVDGKTYATMTYRRRIGSLAEGLEFVAEVATGLSAWSAATVAVGNPDYVGDGTETVTVRSTVAVEDGASELQMRLRVTAP